MCVWFFFEDFFGISCKCGLFLITYKNNCYFCLNFSLFTVGMIYMMVYRRVNLCLNYNLIISFFLSFSLIRILFCAIRTHLLTSMSFSIPKHKSHEVKPTPAEDEGTWMHLFIFVLIPHISYI